MAITIDVKPGIMTRADAAKALLNFRKKFGGFIDMQSLIASKENMDTLHEVEGTLYQVAKNLDPDVEAD